MSIYYVDGTDGDDNHSGTSEEDAKESQTDGVVGEDTVTFTSALAHFQTNGVTTADKINIIGQGLFGITRIDSETQITLSSAATPGADLTYHIGGCWATIQKAADTAIAGDTVYIQKHGVYTVTAQIDFDINSGSETDGYISFIGYENTIDDDGKAQITKTGAVSYILYINASRLKFKNLEIYGADNQNIRSYQSYHIWENIISRNSGHTGFVEMDAGNKIYRKCISYIHTCTGFQDWAYKSFFLGCYSYTNGWDGFSLDSPSQVAFCIARDNNRFGFQLLGAFITLLNCVIDQENAGDDCIYTKGTTYIFNCIIVNAASGHYGIGYNSLPKDVVEDYNDFYNNAADRQDGIVAGEHDLALDPQFADASNGNYSIGTNLKAKGFPGAFPGGLSTGYLDIGAVQREEPAGGGETSNAFIG